MDGQVLSLLRRRRSLRRRRLRRCRVSKHPFIDQWLGDGWTVGQFQPGDGFRRIGNHSCVCKPNKEVIAVTGPAEDLESQKLSDLIAAAPEMFLAISDFRELMTDKSIGMQFSCNPPALIQFQKILRGMEMAYRKAAGVT